MKTFIFDVKTIEHVKKQTVSKKIWQISKVNNLKTVTITNEQFLRCSFYL